MKMKFLGVHNFESTNTRLPSILIDGIMAIDAGSLTSSLSFVQQGNIGSVLLTHGHYDHIRDIPLLALRNSYRTIDIYAIQDTLDIMETHLIDGALYPKFTQWPSSENPTLRLHRLEPHRTENINGYSVLPIPVSHSIPAVGFEITGKRGQKVFFSGDTGAGLSSCWQHISPSILIIETTFPNKLADFALKTGHLCPLQLGTELMNFNQTKGYFPKVVLTHLNPEFEDEIRKEVSQIAKKLGADIRLAYEGMEL